MELIRLYNILLRRRWLLIQAVVLVTAAAVALSFMLPRTYKATARVLVSSSDTTLSILSDLGLGEVAAGLSNSSDDVQNKIELATTWPVVEEIVWRLQLRDEGGRLYEPEEIVRSSVLSELEARPHVAITQQQGTDIIVFEALADDPELARLLAETHVRVAIQRAQERARADTRSARRFIEQQLQVVQQEFDRSMSDIADAKAQQQVVDIESEMKATIARLNELMLAYEQNTAAIQEVRARLAEARAYQSRETVDRMSPTTATTNPKILDLQERIAELEQQRQEALTDKTEKHPDIARLDQLLTEAREDLARALEEQHAMDPTVAQLEAQLAGLVQKGQGLDAAIRRVTAEFGTFPEKMRNLSQLELAANAAEKVYESLQEQRYQMGVAEALIVSDLQLVEPARAPERAYRPRIVFNTVVGFVLGCVVGLGLVFLFEYVDDSIKVPEDLREVWDAPRLGLVPRFKINGDRRIIDELDTTHPISEAFRTLRNGLVFASLDKPANLIGVTSAMPGEGKSTCSANLAVSFAREGKRVLLVDCDLRRPTQHRNFPSTSGHVGLTDLLTRRVEPDEALQATPVDGLFLLASGPIPTDPARLVESLRLRQLLVDLSKSFDVVVVDMPPALVVNDALVVARSLDGMIVVVESGRTSRKVLSELRGRFEAAGIQPLGVVLNKVDLLGSGYGHYRSAYRRYYREEEKGGGRWIRRAPRRERRSGGAA